MGESWKEKARQSILGDIHNLESLPGYWVRAKRFSVIASDEIREAENLPASLMRKLAKLRPDKDSAENRADFERRAADALTDEEFSMLQRLSVSLDPKIAGLRLTHGIGEHNFTDDGSASTVVPRDLVEELLKYKPVALEILEVIAQANPGPFLRGRSGSSSSSSSGSTPEPETTKAGTSPTTQSGMMASGATSR